jgi:hypothetical protein
MANGESSPNPPTSGPALDTGTGGFPDANGNLLTYDSGLPEAGNGPAIQWSGGQINVDLTGPDGKQRDLTNSTKATLGSYLSKTTLGQTNSSGKAGPNKYPVQNYPLTPPVVLNLNDEARLTNTIAIDSAQPDETGGFVNSQPGDQRTIKYDPLTEDGNNLLRTDEAAVNASNRYSAILANNRFNVDNTYLENSTLNSAQFHSAYKSGISEATDDSRALSFGQLAQLGTSLSIRAGLELGSRDRGNNPNSGNSEAGALLPGWSQMGLERVDNILLTAKDALENLSSTPIEDGQLIDPAGLSWGTMNNSLDQFSGITNFGMQLLAVALVLALALVIVSLVALFALLGGGGGGKTKYKDNLGRKPYGAASIDANSGDYTSVTGILSAILSGKFNFWRMIGMTSTKTDLLKALPTGALAFFGSYGDIVTLGSMPGAVADAAINSAQSPGYYAVMARSINRSFLKIGDAFSALGNAFSSGLVAGIKALLGIIDVFRNSQFIRALNVFSQLGDRLIIEYLTVAPELREDTDSSGAGKRFKSRIDNNSNSDAASKSRLSVTANDRAFKGVSPLTLAWTTHRAPDLFVIPQNLVAAFSADKKSFAPPSLLPTAPVSNDSGIRNGGIYQAVSDESSRITTEVREKFEDSLEAEYVPFYFHDVRTNEIVSFHAFLASLSDGLTASYDSTDAFGRVEQIKTYKGTQRRVGFSFYIVATSPKDFDSMWLKINKLTTLMYPQFSEGRQLNDPTGKYILQAPFSQTMQASPLVRLRIGDLIKSNFSRFNLARLFGYTYKGTKFDGKQLAFQSINLANESLTGDILNKAQKSGNTFTTSSPLGPIYAASSSGVSIGTDSSPNDEIDPNLSLPNGLVLEYMGPGPDDNPGVICKVIEATGTDLLGMPMQPSRAEIEQYNGADKKKHIIGKTFLIDGPSLNMTFSTQKKSFPKGTSTDYTSAAEKFMDPKTGNAIAKSFRSVGGKGLAGFIESMEFDWYDKTTWEIGHGISTPTPAHGRRAPKMCKVTIAFSPIHDVTPGLDHLGSNRAPVYPIGPLASYDMSDGFTDEQGNK